MIPGAVGIFIELKNILAKDFDDNSRATIPFLQYRGIFKKFDNL